jgi:hypothetical protein
MNDIEYLDPDDVGLLNSPPLRPIKVSIQPSPSPPPFAAPTHGQYYQGGDETGRSKVSDARYDLFDDEPDTSGWDFGQELVGDDYETSEDERVIDRVTRKTSPSPGIYLDALAADALRQSQRPTIPSISTLYVDGSESQSSRDPKIKREMSGSPEAGELPTIRQHSRQSALSNGIGSGHITLPSISDQLRDIQILAEAPRDSAFSQSPPARPPSRFSAVPQHGSPPKSPNDTFRRELPSPGRGHFYFNANSHRRLSQTDGPQYSSYGDYSSGNTETPGTDQSGSTPVMMAIDRTSIDGITNPQIGGFQCTYPGCTAQPFQTQVYSVLCYCFSIPNSL